MWKAEEAGLALEGSAVASDAIAATVATLFVGELMQRYPVRYVGSIGLTLIALIVWFLMR